MPKPKAKWDTKPSDWGLGWLAVFLGVISLYIYLTSKNPRRRRRQLPGGHRPTSQASQGGLSKNSYFGWKVLINFKVISDCFEIRSVDVDVLLHIASACDLYILNHVDSDVEEELTLNACQSVGLIQAGLKPCKVLFCSTRKGKEAISRQLSPALYVDDDLPTIEYLAAHLPHITLIDAGLPATSSTATSSATTPEEPVPAVHPHPTMQNVMLSPSLADFFRYVMTN
mmetsp:Transcript_80299/g.141618  ORF Transcript_80299/g.141618 Transcript_80299/m.141618 type:complete len:227 (-) Transcript_80299:331-1011(-)